MKIGMDLKRLFGVDKPEDHVERLRAMSAEGEAVELMSTGPGWRIIIRELDRLLQTEHDQLMRKDNPISADEYRGFVRAISLVATTPQGIVSMGRDAAEELQREREE